MFIVGTDSDGINLLICMIVQTDSQAKVMAVRVRTREFQQWGRILNRMGLRADRIIHPETTIMWSVMRVLQRSGVSELLDFADGLIELLGETSIPAAGSRARASRISTKRARRATA